MYLKLFINLNIWRNLNVERDYWIGVKLKINPTPSAGVREEERKLPICEDPIIFSEKLGFIILTLVYRNIDLMTVPFIPKYSLLTRLGERYISWISLENLSIFRSISGLILKDSWFLRELIKDSFYYSLNTIKSREENST